MTQDTPVTRPAHYGGEANPFEPIKIIEHYRLGFHLGNTLKYLLRCDKKGSEIEDLKKARWYLDRYIEMRSASRKFKMITGVQVNNDKILSGPTSEGYSLHLNPGEIVEAIGIEEADKNFTSGWKIRVRRTIEDRTYEFYLDQKLITPTE